MKTTPLLLSVLALTAFAEEAKPNKALPIAATQAAEAGKPAEAPKTVQVETLTSDGKTFVLVKVIGDPQAFANFQNDVQTISQEQQQVAQVKQLAELALTTPEREARIRELETKFNRLKTDNETMAKTYGFDLTRQYVIVPTKVVVLTALTNEDYIKAKATAGFKEESILNAGDKKFLIKETVTGAAEVEAFKLQLQRIIEAKRGLQQLIDAQPRFTKEEDKKKIEDAIAKTKADVDAAGAEFKKDGCLPGNGHSEARATMMPFGPSSFHCWRSDQVSPRSSLHIHSRTLARGWQVTSRTRSRPAGRSSR